MFYAVDIHYYLLKIASQLQKIEITTMVGMHGDGFHTVIESRKKKVIHHSDLALSDLTGSIIQKSQLASLPVSNRW